MRVQEAQPERSFMDPPTFDEYLNVRPCVISLQVKAGACEPSRCTSEVWSDAAHAPQTRRYGQYRVPLCRGHHHEQHTIGILTFAAKYFKGGVGELKLMALMYERRYRKFLRRLGLGD